MTKPSRQCRKKPQGSPPPHRATITEVEASTQSAATTPPSSEEDAPTVASMLSNTDSSSSPNSTDLCAFSGWYPASEYGQPHQPNHEALDEQHSAPHWAVSTVYPSPARNNSCHNREPYEYPNTLETISPIHPYIPQHSTTSPVGSTPVDVSPPLCSPFTDSAFPELCFSALPPSEYEWSVRLREDIKQADLATTNGYTSPAEAIHPLSTPPNCAREPTSVSILEYTNYMPAPPSEDGLPAYGEQHSFLDGFSSIESLTEIGSWRRAVNGSFDNGLVEGAMRVDPANRVPKS